MLTTAKHQIPFSDSIMVNNESPIASLKHIKIGTNENCALARLHYDKQIVPMEG